MIVRGFNDAEGHGIVLTTRFDEGRMYLIHRKGEKECNLEERAEKSTLVDEHCSREGREGV